MIKNGDDSITLSKEELQELNKAYQGLHDILSDMPACLGDYFSKYEEYINVKKWHCLLNGEDFDRSDWE